ncbi:MAG: serine hydrolase [Chitinophagaceae bacterium]
MAVFSAYHGVTHNQHQLHYNDLSGKGYHMIALSVYGSPSDARYAATWVKRLANQQAAIHGASATAYQQFVNDCKAQGYAPLLLSATGNRNNAVFAAVFEKGGSGAWKARHDMGAVHEPNNLSFDEENNAARAQGLMLQQVTIYGAANDKRYAAIWRSNPGYVKWHVHAADTNYQASFNAETQLNIYRPAHVVSSEHGVYCSVFKDDMLGSWAAGHGMSSDAYQLEFDKQAAKGLMPICIDGSGTGANTVYSAIFAATDIPQQRLFSKTGSGLAVLAGLDGIVQSFMQQRWVRCLQLSIGKNGVNKYNKAFTWAEQDYRNAQTSDRFLLASCSKIFVNAAVQFCYDDPSIDLSPGDKVYSILGFSSPKDARSNQITIQQLLDHTSGIDTSFDPTYKMRDIARELQHALSKDDICRYMYKNKSLNNDPGAVDAYSNYGYLLATRVVEKLSNQDYFQFLKSKILTPENITEVKVWPTSATPRPGNEVLQEDQWMHAGAVDYNSDVLAPDVYGGDGMIKETAAGSCGIAASANALSTFIHNHAAWGTGGRSNGRRSGGTPGASSWAESRSGGFDWSFNINTRDFGGPTPDKATEDFIKKINDFLTAAPAAL